MSFWAFVREPGTSSTPETTDLLLLQLASTDQGIVRTLAAVLVDGPARASKKSLESWRAMLTVPPSTAPGG